MAAPDYFNESPLIQSVPLVQNYGSTDSSPHIPRTLVLCFDGTANQYDDTNTNVVRFFSCLEKSDHRQLVYYQVRSRFACSPLIHD